MPKKTEELTHPERPLDIAGRFLKERERLKITHADLKRRTGVSRFSIGRFEKGQRGIDSDALLSLLFVMAEDGARLDYIILGRSSAPHVALTASSIQAVAAELAAHLAAPAPAQHTKRRG